MSRGNVLFLILLAVALFAVLSYAVTQSSRSSGKSVSDEAASLHAAQITQYATNLEQVVSRLRLVNSCRDTQISFAADSDNDGSWYDTDDDYHNAYAPDDFSCHVFHPNGGNLQPLDIPEDWLDTNQSALANYQALFFTGDSCIAKVGTGSINCAVDGTSASEELIMVLPYLREDICRVLSEKLYTQGSSSDIAIDSSDSYEVTALFTGTYNNARAISNAASSEGDNSRSLDGKHSACYQAGPSGNNPQAGTYHYFHVLIPR